MPKFYWVYQESGPKAVAEAWERAENEGHTPRHDRIGVQLVGRWDVFGLKPYLISLMV